MTEENSPNPFLMASRLDCQLPDFAAIDVVHYLPGFEAGFSEQLAQIASITSDPAAATFENTVLAMERSGAILTRVVNVFFNIASSHGTAEIQALEAMVAPRLAEHEDTVLLNGALYERMLAVPAEGLDAESLRLLAEYRKAFTRAGVALPEESRERLRELNAQLSSLSTKFSQLVMQAGNQAALHIQDVAELDGLSADDVATAAAAARAAGHAEGYLLTLILPTAQPALEVLTNRQTRQKLHLASVGRGSGGGAGGGDAGGAGGGGDAAVLGLAATMASLRAEKAALLGFSCEAERSIEPQTAPSLAAVHCMLAPITAAAVRNARLEAEKLAATAGHFIEAWDWAFYSEQIRRDEYGVDQAALRPWFELDSVLENGVFYAATQLYGITFRRRSDLIGYHPDVRIWEVSNADGSVQGLFLGDFYTRATKRGGAWMNSFVEQSFLENTHAVVVNNLNIPQPPAGEPTLLTFDEVVTCFHEFGHALHGLFSAVSYPKFSGTNVPRDFVEYPSQVNEMWILWPEVLANYAKHHRTGEPLPVGTAEKLQAAALWGQGFATTEYLGATLLDLAWHELAPGAPVADPLAFEAAALAAAGVDIPAVPPRYRTGYFNHIFAGGYAAGYYSYLWSEVLDADTVAWFKSNGGLTRTNGEHFRSTVLSRGFSVDPLLAFADFAGRAADTAPLLARRGLV
ncbi:M3 family metallopeptidase [Arthrobacter psychrochitiniphilus]|uniref:Peptidase M3 n=1 Tax=Arthrobacter psychrochitiniphilus TaxID=291045 RepID=A0A2V3DR84_9MICC|nr:M3 family metallopeptidase [Arthrobacter psychrochitiniphilus]NYG17733.1 peptidyl-dipeptidase Dcp [Arthrobacter psychrochitiniphilus]PXA65211.1 peptidase M3 [Arthrobacter psychrochitiniphilus]